MRGVPRGGVACNRQLHSFSRPLSTQDRADLVAVVAEVMTEQEARSPTDRMTSMTMMSSASHGAGIGVTVAILMVYCCGHAFVHAGRSTVELALVDRHRTTPSGTENQTWSAVGGPGPGVGIEIARWRPPPDGSRRRVADRFRSVMWSLRVGIEAADRR